MEAAVAGKVVEEMAGATVGGAMAAARAAEG